MDQMRAYIGCAVRDAMRERAVCDGRGEAASRGEVEIGASEAEGTQTSAHCDS